MASAASFSVRLPCLYSTPLKFARYGKAAWCSPKNEEPRVGPRGSYPSRRSCRVAESDSFVYPVPHVVERLLNHKLGSIGNKTDGIVSAVAEVYNRAAYMNEMREAVQLWEKYLTALIAEKENSDVARAA